MLKYSSSTSTQYYNPGSCVYPNSQSALVTGQDMDVLVVLMSRTLIGHTNVRSTVIYDDRRPPDDICKVV